MIVHKPFILVVTIPMTFLFFTSCGVMRAHRPHTSIVSIQDDYFKEKPLGNILVVGISHDLQIRKAWEDILCLQLLDYEVNAYRGMEVIPPLKDYSNIDIYQILKQNSIDVVFTFAVMDFWTEYYKTPEYMVAMTSYDGSSKSETNFNGYLFNPIFTTKTSTSGTATTVIGKQGGHIYSWETARLDVRLLRFNSNNTFDIIWRAHSTTEGSIFTGNGEVLAEGAYRICRRLLTDGFLKADADRIKKRMVLSNLKGLGLLTVWGGKRHDHKLGYFNYKNRPNLSITNTWGRYGKLKKDGIWNPSGIYASDTSDCSACNPNATYPPIVKNKKGEVMGYLTINTSKFNAIIDRKVIEWLETEICGQKEK